jgi:hypothetical protein
MDFVWFANDYAQLEPWFDAISAEEWKDLTFFARPILKTGEQYYLAVTRALDQLDSPVESRSISKHRLAWKDVEFWRDDVIREWPDTDDAANQGEVQRQPRSDAAPETTDGRAPSRSLTKAFLRYPTGICTRGTKDAPRS